jgi:hypothetical protein
MPSPTWSISLHPSVVQICQGDKESLPLCRWQVTQSRGCHRCRQLSDIVTVCSRSCSNLQCHSSSISWLRTVPTHKLERSTHERKVEMICNMSTLGCCHWEPWTPEYGCLGSPFIAQKDLGVVASFLRKLQNFLYVGTPGRPQQRSAKDLIGAFP